MVDLCWEVRDMIKNTFTVRNKATGQRFSCIPQMVDLCCNGKYVLRYNIGINGYTEWSFIEAIYDNDTFNREYEVIK